MPMKWSTRFVKAATLNLLTALVLCAVCEFLAIYVWHVAPAEVQAAGWSWPMFGINFVVAWISATIIGMIPALPDKGFQFGMKHAKPSDGLKFGAWINVYINTWYAVILNIIMTVLDTFVLGGAPMAMFFPLLLIGWAQNIIPVWIFCYVVTLFCQGPCENLARKVCNDPVPPMGGPQA